MNRIVLPFEGRMIHLLATMEPFILIVCTGRFFSITETG
jgi:hypothetical protein